MSLLLVNSRVPISKSLIGLMVSARRLWDTAFLRQVFLGMHSTANKRDNFCDLDQDAKWWMPFKSWYDAIYVGMVGFTFILTALVWAKVMGVI